MERINWSRVIAGGLLAGLVLNVLEMIVNGFFLADQWPVALKALGKDPDLTVKQLAAFNVLGFATGVFAIWLYAALRPRFGAGPRTAACAGLAVWFLGYVLASGTPIVLRLFPAGMMATAIAAGLVECVVATIVGASLYKEGAAPVASRAAAA